MRTQTPKFLLGSPQGWETFDAAGGFVVLAGFSSQDTAANYCVATARPTLELQPLQTDGLRERIEARFSKMLKLVAVDPASQIELSLVGVTLEAVRRALDAGQQTIESEYRLMRDHRADAWKSLRISGAVCPAKPPKWYVACVHPENMTLAEGQPLWFWLDWFDGQHVATELQTERGGRMERDVFLFGSPDAAEAFHGATLARLRGSVCRCHVDSHHGDQFEVAVWEEGSQPCRSTAAIIGERLDSRRS
jgi:hypothetical protein